MERETAVAEVAFHKRRFLENARMTGQYAFDYQDFLAHFSGQFHYLDSDESQACLQPGSIPQSHGASQALANALLYAGSGGILYPSVRLASGTCIACFRPALVFYPRRGQEDRITLEAGTDQSIAHATVEMIRRPHISDFIGSPISRLCLNAGSPCPNMCLP